MQNTMNMSEEKASLTKGCFVHKPSKVKKRKSTKSVSCSSKLTQYASLWNEMECKIQEIEKQSHKETFDSIVNFINQCSLTSVQEVDEIPSVVFVMGVNRPDHSNIFALLEHHLHTNKMHGTVILESKKCWNFSNMLQIIVNEIVAKYQKILGFTEVSVKKQDCSFEKLYTLWQNNFCEETNPKMCYKNVSSDPMLKPLIFLIQDVEAFSVELLQELIFVCKRYAGKLPIVLVFGMASAMVTLHSMLPQKALCCLGIETFYTTCASESLTRIIEEVIISPQMPFKMGPRVFRLIIDIVLYHDFSVLNLTHLLKYSVAEHFFGSSIAKLCCNESEIQKKVQNMDSEDLELLKMLPSFQMYLKTKPNLTPQKDFKVTVLKLFKKIFRYQNIVKILLKFLHCLVKDLPGYPLGRKFRELYSIFLEEEIVNTDAYAEALKLLKMLSHNELVIKLKECHEIVNAPESVLLNASVLIHAKTVLECWIEKLMNLNADDFEKKPLQNLLLNKNEKLSRFRLQEKMLSTIQNNRSKFESLRNEIVSNLYAFFGDIRSPSTFPFHEIFYFDDVSSLKKHLLTVPKITLCRTLSNPHRCLKCNCCKIIETGEIQPSMPDIAVLYKLHLESGKLINLCDWLTAFKSIKDKDEEIKTKLKNKKKRKLNDSELNIRFIQAASELELLGFIKPTKRKTDHVSRLTFVTF
ncbi:origin recognition complex subunit 3-like isoform X2 [Stegodyphus dumicola]|uniref:origin recognition complex subunit 3-like isoform X2 n=1 Tax=Stegodyphus dumicola TaxID=202533 RepID=UPI0015AB2DD8|nr:origin recognition complex subunit 3-like isoform X2 [Stegodyphus dumicola]